MFQVWFWFSEQCELQVVGNLEKKLALFLLVVEFSGIHSFNSLSLNLISQTSGELVNTSSFPTVIDSLLFV